MAIGTTLGQAFPDEFSHVTAKFSGADNNVLDPDTNPDLDTQDTNEIKPDRIPQPIQSDASATDVADVEDRRGEDLGIDWKGLGQSLYNEAHAAVHGYVVTTFPSDPNNYNTNQPDSIPPNQLSKDLGINSIKLESKGSRLDDLMNDLALTSGMFTQTYKNLSR